MVSRTVASAEPPAAISTGWAAVFTTPADVIFWAAGETAGAEPDSEAEFGAGLEQAALTNSSVRQVSKVRVERVIMLSCVFLELGKLRIQVRNAAGAEPRAMASGCRHSMLIRMFVIVDRGICSLPLAVLHRA